MRRFFLSKNSLHLRVLSKRAADAVRFEVTPRRERHELSLHAVDAVRPIIAALAAKMRPSWAVDTNGEPRGVGVFSSRTPINLGVSQLVFAINLGVSPVRYLSHASSPSRLNLPSTQSLQMTAPVVTACNSTAVFPLLWLAVYLPPLQTTQCVSAMVPGTPMYFPALQTMQSDWWLPPVTSRYFPATHSMQSDAWLLAATCQT